MTFSPDSLAVRISNQNRWPDLYVTCPQCDGVNDCPLCLDTKLVSLATADNGEQSE